MFVKHDVPSQEEAMTWPACSGASTEVELVSGPLFQLRGRFPHLRALRLICKVPCLLNVSHLPWPAPLLPAGRALPLLRLVSEVFVVADC